MLPRSIVEEDLPTVPLAKGRPSAAPAESSRHAKGHLGAVRSSLFCSKGLPIVSFQNSAQKYEKWISENYRSIVHPVSLLLLFPLQGALTDRNHPSSAVCLQAPAGDYEECYPETKLDDDDAVYDDMVRAS